jgi:pectate disaccharide-lyase
MRTLSVILLVLFKLNLNAQSFTYYINYATGSDTNSGVIAKPFKTISKGLTALGSNIGTLYLRGGTHISTSKISLLNAGLAGNYIKIWAYPGEKPVIDFTGNSSDGFSVKGSFYHLKGLEVKNAGHNGINISGNNNIIENCAVHNNSNTGLHITGGNGAPGPGPSNNLILNCDSYFNFDSPVGGNADGFSAKWTVGTGNVFRGCRSYNNSDDGWDLWMCTGSIIIDSCIAFRNGIDTWHTGSVSGNGNGFKVGGNYIATPHIVTRCLSFDNGGNTGRGFDENNNTAGQTLYNCTSFRNEKSNFYFNNDPLTSGTHIIKNCISYKPGLPDAIRNATLETNSWNGFTVADSDFISVDTAGIVAPRNADGSLPWSNFLTLAPKSNFIDKGVDVGLIYNGSNPDLGYSESYKDTDQYILTTGVASGNGKVSPSGSIKMFAGFSVSVKAVPGQAYKFLKWTDTTGAEISISNPYKITISASDVKINANFINVPQYNLTTSIANGSGTISPAGPAMHDSGFYVKLTAIPASHYTFVNWGGDASGSKDTVSVLMNADKNVTALFALVKMNFSGTVFPESSGTISPSGTLFDYGSTVIFTATASDGYIFDKWTDDPGNTLGTSTSLSITFLTDKSIYANFTRPTFIHRAELSEKDFSVSNWKSNKTTTSFTLNLKKQAKVKADLYNIVGIHLLSIIDNNSSSGTYNIEFMNRSLKAGIYICKIVVNGNAYAHKLVINNK